MKKVTILPQLGLVLATIIWGFSFVVVKDALDVVPPFFLTAFRFSLAAIVMVLVFHKKLKLINKDYLISGVLLGLFIYVGTILQTVALKYTDAGVCAFLTAADVIWSTFLAWMIFRKRPGKKSLVAVGFAIVGIGLLSLSGGTSFGLGLGEMLALLCGVGYAMQMVLADRFTKIQDPVLLSVLQMIFATVFSWIVTPVFEGKLASIIFEGNTTSEILGQSIPAAMFSNSQFWIAILYTGVLSTAVAFLLKCMAQKHLSVTTTAILVSTESVFGTIFSVLILHEALGPRKLAGFVLMFAAVIISQVTITVKKKSDCEKP